MNEILKQIGAYGVVPVVKIDNVEDALPLGKALCDGGLPLAEITFRTAAAEEAPRLLFRCAFPAPVGNRWRGSLQTRYL